MPGINPPSPPAPLPSPPRVGDKRGRCAIENPDEPQTEMPNDPRGEKPNDPKDPKADVSIIGLKDQSPDFLLAFKEECQRILLLERFPLCKAILKKGMEQCDGVAAEMAAGIEAGENSPPGRFWVGQLKQDFDRVVVELGGLEKATPKKLLAALEADHPKLTRAQCGSRLQKRCLKAARCAAQPPGQAAGGVDAAAGAAPQPPGQAAGGVDAAAGAAPQPPGQAAGGVDAAAGVAPQPHGHAAGGVDAAAGAARQPHEAGTGAARPQPHGDV